MRHRLGSRPEAKWFASTFRSPGMGLLVGFQGAIVGVLPQCFRDGGGLVKEKTCEFSIS
jgi:hypothetical protein